MILEQLYLALGKTKDNTHEYMKQENDRTYAFYSLPKIRELYKCWMLECKLIGYPPVHEIHYILHSRLRKIANKIKFNEDKIKFTKIKSLDFHENRILPMNTLDKMTADEIEITYNMSSWGTDEECNNFFKQLGVIGHKVTKLILETTRFLPTNLYDFPNLERVIIDPHGWNNFRNNSNFEFDFSSIHASWYKYKIDLELKGVNRLPVIDLSNCHWKSLKISTEFCFPTDEAPTKVVRKYFSNYLIIDAENDRKWVQIDRQITHVSLNLG